MAHAATGHPIVYYAPPSKPAALYERHFPSIGAVRKFAQGAGTALLGFSGANAMTGEAAAGAPTVADFTTLDGFTQAVLEGRLTGPAQLIAGAFLFLAAGRCTARLLGLFIGLTLIYFYMQGVTLTDMLRYAAGASARVAEALSAFASAEAAQQ
ncbi:MAG: hypothetical protein ACOZAA_10760 [Pseudomonadota bacterium]